LFRTHALRTGLRKLQALAGIACGLLLCAAAQLQVESQ